MTLQVERPYPPWITKAKKKASPIELMLWDALEEVEDPEYPVSVVDMGLIYNLRFANGDAHVDLSFTSMGCPCMEYIIEDVRERLLKEETVTAVHLQIVWDPPWTKKRLTPKAIEKLTRWGVAI